MKKLAFLSIVLALLVTLFPAAVSAYTISATLYAGQENNIAGYVKIWNDADNLYVRYWMKSGAGWCLNETHVQVATSLDGIPQNNGGAIPGQFDYKAEHDCVRDFTQVIPLEDGWRDNKTELFIAVHAVVTGPDGEETGWAVRCGDLDSVQFTGPGWSAYLVFTRDAWN